MAYCTVEDVCGELHPTLKLHMEQHYGAGFNAVLMEHIKKADACAEASLARAYRVPLKKTTNIVTSAVCKIAAYYAAAAFSEKEAILKDKYETAMLMLDHLVEADDGSLVGEDDDTTVFTGAGYGTAPRIFTCHELSKW